MYNDSLGSLFELDWLAVRRGDEVCERMVRGAEKRYNLAEKMIMNQLQDMMENEAYGELINE